MSCLDNKKGSSSVRVAPHEASHTSTKSQERKTRLRFLSRVWPERGALVQLDRQEDSLQLPHWLNIQAKDLKRFYVTEHNKKLINLPTLASKISESDAVITLNRTIQWHRQNEVLVEVGVTLGQVKLRSFIEGMDAILSALSMLLGDKEEIVRSSFVAEIAHHHLMLLSLILRGKQLPEANVAAWRHLVKDSLLHLETMHSLPINMLSYELSLIFKGLNSLPTDSKALVNCITAGIGGAVTFIATGNPVGLINALKQGAVFSAKMALKAHDASVFDLVYQVEAFKRWALTKKIELQSGPEENRYDTLREVKAYLIRFEHVVLRVNHRWEITYAWVKALGDLLTTDAVTIRKEKLPRHWINVTFKTLVEAGWISQLNADQGFISPTLSGQLPGVDAATHQEVKDFLLGQLNEMKNTSGAKSFMEFLYFGDARNDQFHGLQHYMNFGLHAGRWGEMCAVGGRMLENAKKGDPLNVKALVSLSLTEQLSRHVDLLFDQTINQLLSEITNRCKEVVTDLAKYGLKAVFEQLKDRMIEREEVLTTVIEPALTRAAQYEQLYTEAKDADLLPEENETLVADVILWMQSVETVISQGRHRLAMAHEKLEMTLERLLRYREIFDKAYMQQFNYIKAVVKVLDILISQHKVSQE